MKINKTFWDNFYKKNNDILNPSNFAKFIYKKYLFKKKNKSFLDIGCGNGRDSFFFYKKGLAVTGIDISSVAIKKNVEKSKLKNLSIKFFKLSIKDAFLKLKNKKYCFAYIRFFLHAIDKKNENILFEFISKTLKKNSLAFFEFRTKNDPLIKKGKKLSLNERITDHYRRFLSKEELITEIKKKNNFKIIYLKESLGFSKTKKENPCLCRMILKKI